MKSQKNELVHLIEGIPTTTSDTMANVFGKDHKRVLQDIRELGCSNEFKLLNFQPMERNINIGNGAVRKDQYYEITRDGFFLLAMGYTGAKAMQFKEAYIGAFNAMERELRELASIRTALSVADTLTSIFPVVVDARGCSSQSRGILGGYIRNHPGLFIKWRGQWRATKPVANVLEKRTELQAAIDEMDGFEVDGQLRLFNSQLKINN
jgi:Rha family phage regulatory protein